MNLWRAFREGFMDAITFYWRVPRRLVLGQDSKTAQKPNETAPVVSGEPGEK